jgi:hypothetical protein
MGALTLAGKHAFGLQLRAGVLLLRGFHAAPEGASEQQQRGRRSRSLAHRSLAISRTHH